MCGITAYFSDTKDYNQSLCINSIETLNHRWPDGLDYYFSDDKKLFLGHSRLAINDKWNGSQPLFSADKKLAAVVNGEFYDYQKIRANLESKWYKFTTDSDSEIILPLYQEYGLDFVAYLRGEFSFVLYDIEEQKLIAGRDRFGIKPLCYYLDEEIGSIFLASEAKGLFEFGIKARWDMYSLYHSLNFQYQPQNRTLFEEIKQLQPWFLLIYDGKELETKKYWDVDFEPGLKFGGNFEGKLEENFEGNSEGNSERKFEGDSEGSFEKDSEGKFEGNFERNFERNFEGDSEKEIEKNLEKQLEQKLIESIKLRLEIWDNKYCFHLSGGVDSSLIAWISASLVDKPIDCFTVSFEDDIYDEKELAEKQAESIWANFFPINIGIDEVMSEFENAVYASEGLAINNHMVSKYLMNKKIKELGYKIILTWEWSDEAFLWYSHLKQDMLGDEQAEKIKKENFVSSGVQLPSGESLDLSYIEEKLWFVPTFMRAKASMGFKLRGLLSDNFLKQFEDTEVFEDIYESLSAKDEFETWENVDISDYIWIKFTLANYILNTLGDGLEAPFWLEGRVPFLDHKLFEFASSIPVDYKLKENTDKYILRKVASRYVIDDIINKWKQPFMAPPILFCPKGFEFIDSIVQSESFANIEFFDQEAIISFIEKIKTMDSAEYGVYEPIVMIILSIYFIDKKFEISVSVPVPGNTTFEN